MHEAGGVANGGGMRRMWALGPLPWDGVGVTRQRSNGEPREGLWAHPRNGTTLVLDAPGSRIGGLLRGFFGLTDFSIDRARAAGATAPVTLTVSIDGTVVLTREA